MQKINKIKYIIVLALYGLGSIILFFKGNLLPAVILLVLTISVYIILKRKMILSNHYWILQVKYIV